MSFEERHGNAPKLTKAEFDQLYQEEYKCSISSGVATINARFEECKQLLSNQQNDWIEYAIQFKKAKEYIEYDYIQEPDQAKEYVEYCTKLKSLDGSSLSPWAINLILFYIKNPHYHAVLNQTQIQVYKEIGTLFQDYFSEFEDACKSNPIRYAPSDIDFLALCISFFNNPKKYGYDVPQGEADISVEDQIEFTCNIVIDLDLNDKADDKHHVLCFITSMLNRQDYEICKTAVDMFISIIADTDLQINLKLKIQLKMAKAVLTLKTGGFDWRSFSIFEMEIDNAIQFYSTFEKNHGMKLDFFMMGISMDCMKAEVMYDPDSYNFVGCKNEDTEGKNYYFTSLVRSKDSMEVVDGAINKLVNNIIHNKEELFVTMRDYLRIIKANCGLDCCEVMSNSLILNVFDLNNHPSEKLKESLLKIAIYILNRYNELTIIADASFLNQIDNIFQMHLTLGMLVLNLDRSDINYQSLLKIIFRGTVNCCITNTDHFELRRFAGLHRPLITLGLLLLLIYFPEVYDYNSSVRETQDYKTVYDDFSKSFEQCGENSALVEILKKVALNFKYALYPPKQINNSYFLQQHIWWTFYLAYDHHKRNLNFEEMGTSIVNLTKQFCEKYAKIQDKEELKEYMNKFIAVINTVYKMLSITMHPTFNIEKSTFGTNTGEFMRAVYPLIGNESLRSDFKTVEDRKIVEEKITKSAITFKKSLSGKIYQVFFEKLLVEFLSKNSDKHLKIIDSLPTHKAYKVWKDKLMKAFKGYHENILAKRWFKDYNKSNAEKLAFKDATLFISDFIAQENLLPSKTKNMSATEMVSKSMKYLESLYKTKSDVVDINDIDIEIDHDLCLRTDVFITDTSTWYKAEDLYIHRFDFTACLEEEELFQENLEKEENDKKNCSCTIF